MEGFFFFIIGMKPHSAPGGLWESPPLPRGNDGARVPGFVGRGRKEQTNHERSSKQIRRFGFSSILVRRHAADAESVCRLTVASGSVTGCFREEAVRRRKSSVRRGEAGGFSAMGRLENHRNVAATVVCDSPPT